MSERTLSYLAGILLFIGFAVAVRFFINGSWAYGVASIIAGVICGVGILRGPSPEIAVAAITALTGLGAVGVMTDDIPKRMHSSLEAQEVAFNLINSIDTCLNMKPGYDYLRGQAIQICAVKSKIDQMSMVIAARKALNFGPELTLLDGVITTAKTSGEPVCQVIYRQIQPQCSVLPKVNTQASE
ncbi:hypothetical protein [Marinobacterium aestuariivivens]|uniref:Uncharacterized protein n=1 Tax=Marinobacterium aestuariivivens TaxID=1698799 RepID=A0ABW2AAC7_9GAMM